MENWTSIEWGSAAAVVSAIAAAVAAIVSFWQAWEFRKQVAKDKVAAKILRTFDHSAATSVVFFEERKKLGRAFGSWNHKNKLEVEEITKKLDSNQELLSAFNFVLSHFERMASAVHYKIIDKDTAKHLFQYSFVGFWQKFEPYLKSEFDRKPALKELYSHSMKLYEDWKKDY